VRLILASGSPRRAEILAIAGLEFEVMEPGVDESRLPDEAPEPYVERLARAKAEAVATEGAVAIGADTVVVAQGRILGKPGHPEEARSMLRELQGGRHSVLTGLAVSGLGPAGPATLSLVDATEVVMGPMTEEEISGYVAGGEPMGKAGAYALQGRGGIFVEAVHGSPYTVIGLPIHLLPRLLLGLGHDIGMLRA
jgi:septum formation protein